VRILAGRGGKIMVPGAALDRARARPSGIRFGGARSRPEGTR
jgi:hypothetical protein